MKPDIKDYIQSYETLKLQNSSMVIENRTVIASGSGVVEKGMVR